MPLLPTCTRGKLLFKQFVAVPVYRGAGPLHDWSRVFRHVGMDGDYFLNSVKTIMWKEIVFSVCTSVGIV